MQDKTVIVGMSGGLDSTATALQLQDQGYRIIGLFLELHSHADPAGEKRLEIISHKLDIPIRRSDLKQLFSRRIISPFIDEYRRGRTPNPCIICNEQVKFKALFNIANHVGNAFVATGHYARICQDNEGQHRLYRGLDLSKEQSYVLYRLPETWLPRTLFPLGNTRKIENLQRVRTKFGDLFENIPESTDLCFLPEGDRASITGKERPGKIVDRNGLLLGHHKGLSWYTIGQRKGLGLPGGPWFVLELDAPANRIVVGTRDELNVKLIEVSGAVWHEQPEISAIYQAQYRYRTRPIPIQIISKDHSGFIAKPLAPVTGVAPGQSLVLYNEDQVLGGGFIERTERR